MIAQLSLPPRAAGAALIAFAVLAIAALPAATASASAGRGEVTLSLTSDAKGSLGKQGIKATYSVKAGQTGAAKRKGAGGSAQVVSLPVDELTLGAGTTVHTAGGLALTLKGRTAELGGLILEVGSRSTAIAAKLGGERLVFFRAKGKAQIGAFSAKLGSAPLSLTRPGAKALRDKLGLDRLASGRVGNATVNAHLLPSLGNDVVTPPSPEAPKKIDDGGLPPKDEGSAPLDPYPYAAQCPVAAVEGSGGFGEVPGQTAGPAPLPGFDAATAQPASGGVLEWGFKDSFRSYVVNAPPPGSMQTLAGAAASPVAGSMANPGSSFDFSVAEGRYEPGSAPGHSDDRLVVAGSGTVLFCKAGHGFSVALKDPALVVDGADSRIVADVGVNQNGEWFGFQRADIAALDLEAVEPQLSDGGNTLRWEDIPATLTDDGFKATGALYPAGESLDPITVETSLQRPMPAQCAIDAGAGAPPAVDFTRAALPTLNNPVLGSGGTINWGFRRATRNTVTLPTPGGGSFQLSGGAGEGYPGNMGGSATPAPGGGLGKFFRFPIAEYAYEAGSADPSDDRLIATSNATVGFCVPNAGAFGIVLSKPTLVIDGAASRLVANAYSYRSPNVGWIGGRVDLVDLDAATISAVAGPGTVSWGEVTPDDTPLNAGIAVAGGLLSNALANASLPAGSGGGGFDPVAAQIELPAP